MVETEGAQRLLERGTVEVAPLAFMRGRTLNQSFIILDEAQNATPEQMKMFLTRIGFGSRAVVTADMTQVDLPTGRSGMTHLERTLTGIDGLAFVHLGSKDVVRHRIVQDIVDAYERAEAADAPSTPPPDAPPPGASHPSDDADIRPATRPLRKGPEGDVQVFGADEQNAAAVDVDRWVALARDVLVAEGVSGDAELSLLFVDEDAIAELNGRFMDAEGPTDVLAFPIDDPVIAGRWPDAGPAGPDRDEPEPGDLPLLLGDVVVCPAVAERQAPEHAGSYDDEMALLVVHGVLHVLGPRPRRARGDRGHAGPRARAARPLPPPAVTVAAAPFWLRAAAVGDRWIAGGHRRAAGAGRVAGRPPRRRSPGSPAHAPRPWPRRAADSADALADAGAPARAVHHDARVPALACQLVQATLVGIVADRRSWPRRDGRGHGARRRRRVRPGRTAPKTWAVLNPERAALAVAAPRAGAGGRRRRSGGPPGR